MLAFLWDLVKDPFIREPVPEKEEPELEKFDPNMPEFDIEQPEDDDADAGRNGHPKMDLETFSKLAAQEEAARKKRPLKQSFSPNFKPPPGTVPSLTPGPSKQKAPSTTNQKPPVIAKPKAPTAVKQNPPTTIKDPVKPKQPAVPTTNNK
ncbi:uncharacterized protein LOC143196435 [Rhynchophorus ferrugineus]|uniref:Uncharacterized protein n=1 Tax=Rhynchophorus ferrugineus TaxID=354439 RepID=A0A834I5Q8_RHYFE|nr:hypothetical protein GWI33_012226 [Rhynchophorus ferrugineus]